jgi:hypothetical protein
MSALIGEKFCKIVCIGKLSCPKRADFWGISLLANFFSSGLIFLAGSPGGIWQQHWAVALQGDSAEGVQTTQRS